MTKTKIDNLYKQIEALQQEVYDIQSECQHTRVVYWNGSVTGNYDSDDMYYKHVECLDCGLQQQIYSHEDEINYKLQGIIGSDIAVKKSEYENWLKVQKQMGSCDD